MTRYRTGRHNRRTIYVQVGDEPDRNVDYQVGTMDTPELGDLVVALLNGDAGQLEGIDRNARAYGWEVGRGQEIGSEVQTSDDNPFLDPDWRDRIPGQGTSDPLPPSCGCPSWARASPAPASCAPPSERLLLPLGEL